jgi:gamma-glutamyltranspeptidase/glutathione hydrolase
MKSRNSIFLLLVLLLVDPVWSASMPPGWARDGMVVTSVRPAADAGKQVLLRGGNASDAAIAVSFAASVAHPFSSGLGGGMFALVHHDGETIALDAREVAPAGVKPEEFIGHPELIRRGPKAVAVPGLVQGLWALHKEHGSLPWKDLIEPAIELAEQGVAASQWHRRIVGAAQKRLQAYPETARIQLDDGKVPELGWVLIQKDLAQTLRHIQSAGGDALASGEYAEKISLATGGEITTRDLSDYRIKWRQPIMGEYRGYQVAGMPPPSSGGVLLVSMLNMLEPFDLKALGKDSSDYIHLLAEVMKLAFADRATYLGDSDFYPVPVERLISRDYARERVSLLRFPPSFGQRPAWAAGAPYVVDVAAGTLPLPDDSGTTQISVMDGRGNAVTMTQSINGLFGSLITVPGTGIVLNNEMDDFSVAPDAPNIWEAVGRQANIIKGGKRPLSSMSPTLLLKDGQVQMVIGGAMGTTIISSVLHSIVNVIDFDMDAQRAVSAPRFHHQWRPERLSMEPEFPRDVRQQLTLWGFGATIWLTAHSWGPAN